MNAPLKSLLFAFAAALAAGPAAVRSDDIDIFTSSAVNNLSTPTVMFLLDNTPNWSRASQKWPDDSGDQGQSEVKAIASVISSITTPVNIGIAEMTNIANDNPSSGGFVRFGARDMNVASNRTALVNILDYISGNINSTKEKIGGQSAKDESAALYELFKYYRGLPAYAGKFTTTIGNDPKANADVVNNPGGGSATAWGQGLRTGYAYTSDGQRYVSPTTGGCGPAYVIYIANNANQVGSAGFQSYEGQSAGNPLPNLAIDGTSGWWTNEWTRFLFQQGITTYILDAYNAQQNADYSAMLKNAATVGGGKYYKVGNRTDIDNALKAILIEIQAVNTSFASASLPINTTNRAQNDNAVYIGSFRPDSDSRPRWLGNLKQYQLTRSGTSIALADRFGTDVVSNTTGFIRDCAVSYWTADTTRATPPTGGGAYWEDVPYTPIPKSACTAPPTTGIVPALPTGTLVPSPFSDWPDGATVEKGGVASVLRRGNNPPTTTTTPTWTVNRNVLTLSGTSLVSLTTSSTGLDAGLVSWVLGNDNNTSLTAPGPEKLSNSATNVRPSVHGDVIHSRPLPVNYGSAVSVIYGANDGMLRAVDGSTGRERWAFVPPEFLGKLQRQYDNSPLVSVPNLPTGITPTPIKKDYGFDGEIGIFQPADNSKIWVYPSMRRGGRMIYALDVTAVDSNPTLKWRFGCPNLANDTGCSSGASGIGQTWSVPSVAQVRGYNSGTKPLVIVGGGYDSCEDANSPSPSCTGRKGGLVYVLDADTGAVVKTFGSGVITGSIAANVALISTQNNGLVDYAYAADTTGSIYRIDFSSPGGTALAVDDWSIRKVASTSGGGRKFLFAPALLPVAQVVGGAFTHVYVAIGSGDREHPLNSQYPYTTPTQNRFYTFIDNLGLTDRTPVNLDNTNVASNLYMKDYTTLNCTTATTCSQQSIFPAGASPSPTAVGYFIDLNGGVGEQTVTSAAIAAGFVVFSTNRALPVDPNTCPSTLGEARGYLVNLFNGSGQIGTQLGFGGTRSSIFPGGGLPPSPVLATVLIDGRATTILIGAAQRSGGAGSALTPQLVTPAIQAKRRLLSWSLDDDNY